MRNYIHLGLRVILRSGIDTPELACQAGFRVVNIGALMGLDEWRREAYKTMLHLNYLMQHYPDVEPSVSVPRIRPCAVGYSPNHPVDDTELVQYILALRLLFPRVGNYAFLLVKASICVTIW